MKYITFIFLSLSLLLNSCTKKENKVESLSPLRYNNKMLNFIRKNVDSTLSPLLKAKKIYTLVNNKIKYTIDDSKSQTAIDVFNTNKGDCNEISYLVTVLARLSGLKSNLVLVPSSYDLVYHACSGIYIDTWIFIDLSQPTKQFDVNIQLYKILDDSEVLALHLVDKESQSENNLLLAKKLYPSFPYLYYALGNLYLFKLNDYKKAVENYDIALNYLPEISWIYHNKAIAFEMCGEYKKAIYFYLLAMRKCRVDMYHFQATDYKYYSLDYSLDNVKNLYDRTTDYSLKPYIEKLILNGYDELIAGFEKVIEKYPDFSLYYYYRGLLYNEKKDYKNAISDIKKAIELEPNIEKFNNALNRLLANNKKK